MKSPKPLSPFNLILTAVLALTFSAGGTALHLASQSTLTDPQDRILDSALALWTMGTTTLIGLLSNQSTNKEQ